MTSFFPYTFINSRIDYYEDQLVMYAHDFKRRCFIKKELMYWENLRNDFQN